MKWSDLSIQKPILETITDEFEFSSLTPVQEHCIPLFLTCKDVAVEAVTGSGKTLAFVVPLLNKFSTLTDTLKPSDVIGLIISPTQELALQTEQVVRRFICRLPSLTIATFVGGHTKPEEEQRLFKESGGHVLIATPGRLDQALAWLGPYLKKLEMLILDEADMLLRLGFQRQLTAILTALPKQRRTGLFSATQTDQVEDLIRAGLRNPYRVTVKQKFNAQRQIQKTPLSLRNYYICCKDEEKLSTLFSFLRNHKEGKKMVFVSTGAAVEYFGKLITNIFKNTTVLLLHGKMKKNREDIFARFREMDRGILLCTSVLARGVDVPHVEWVLQFDPPREPEEFVHRCGRTARMGSEGSALLFLVPSELAYVDFLKISQKAPLEEYVPDFEVLPASVKIRKMMTHDRALFEKSVRAFVSFIQFYTKHTCKAIFLLKELDVNGLVESFGLLEVPKVPELKGRGVEVRYGPVDTSVIPYKDKIREKARLKRLQSGPIEVKEGKVGGKGESWSKKKEQREKRLKRKTKKELIRSLKEPEEF